MVMAGMLWIRKSLDVFIARGEQLYQNDEDACRKFENYHLMETNPDVVPAILELYINRNI